MYDNGMKTMKSCTVHARQELFGSDFTTLLLGCYVFMLHMSKIQRPAWGIGLKCKTHGDGCNLANGKRRL